MMSIEIKRDWIENFRRARLSRRAPRDSIFNSIALLMYVGTLIQRSPEILGWLKNEYDVSLARRGRLGGQKRCSCAAVIFFKNQLPITGEFCMLVVWLVEH